MMSFIDTLPHLDSSKLSELFYREYSTDYIQSICQKESITYLDFLALLSPSAEKCLFSLARKSHQLTQQHFGKTIQLFVPLYLSNECTNTCLYCGFNKFSSIERHTLNESEIHEEMKILKDKGFSHLLLLTGESPEKVGLDYVCKAIRIAKQYFSSVSLEIFPTTLNGYKELYSAGATGLTLYQETYHQQTYACLHPSGPKADYANRLLAPERALRAGFRQIGLGALLGLYDWRHELAYLASHAKFLMKTFWKTQISISFPRVCASVQSLAIQYPVSDRHLAQMIFAIRCFLPFAEIVLSTRESAVIRDSLIHYGVTRISAESHTNPGGYINSNSGEQFRVSDVRSLKEIMLTLNNHGFDPILKDWSTVFSKNL